MCCAITSLPFSRTRSHAALAFINRFSSSRAVAIIGPCCCSRMMLVVNALITPSLRVRVLESSKTTINKLSPSTMSDIKARPTGIRSVKTLQGKCNITRLILSNHGSDFPPRPAVADKMDSGEYGDQPVSNLKWYSDQKFVRLKES